MIAPASAANSMERRAVQICFGAPPRISSPGSGHKARAVFDRYHIVSPGDLQDGAQKLSGTFSGTSG